MHVTTHELFYIKPHREPNICESTCNTPLMQCFEKQAPVLVSNLPFIPQDCGKIGLGGQERVKHVASFSTLEDV